jgi:hypothetical protein
MSNFTEVIRSRIDRSGHLLTKVVEPHPHQVVKSVSGEQIHIKSSQILTLHQQASTFRQQATGNFQNVLTGGGSIDIPLRENSGHGHVKDVYLRIDISNGSGGAINLMPVPQWIERIDILTPSGTRIEQLYEEFLWHDTKQMSSKEWKYWAPLMNTTKNWGISNDVIPNGDVRRYFLKLNGSWIENASPFLPHINGEVIFRVYFRAANQIFISGASAGVNITRLELEYDSPFMLQSEFAAALNKHRSMVHDHRYNFPIRQQYTQNLTPGQEVNILLSGFNGLFRDLQFFVRTANASLRDKFDYLPINYYEILDTNGQDILGGNFEYHEEDIIAYSNHYDNDMRRHMQLYTYDFSASPLTDGTHGTLTGYYPFSGRETLRIFLNAAVQNRVLTMASAGAVTAGNYRYKFRDEYTAWLAFGANAAAQQTAIAALPSFYKTNTTVVISGVATGGATITYNGQQLQEDTKDLLQIESGVAHDQDIAITETTAFIRGMAPAGQYEVVLMGHQAHMLRFGVNGDIIVRSS